MVSKLYKAVDALDGNVSAFLVSDKGVAISTWRWSDDVKIWIVKETEHDYDYDNIEEFTKRAINPVLISEW